MKALVLSDSHGSFQSIMNAVESEKDISLIILPEIFSVTRTTLPPHTLIFHLSMFSATTIGMLTTFLMTDCLSFPANVFF